MPQLSSRSFAINLFPSKFDFKKRFSVFGMVGGCLVYPSGWDYPKVREVCDSHRYNLGLCELKWAYALAFVLVIDQIALSLLGFILACKQPPSIPEIHCNYRK